jgi:hypothetical protein
MESHLKAFYKKAKTLMKNAAIKLILNYKKLSKATI